MTWISVEERLPEINGDYIVCTKKGNIRIMPFFTGRDASCGIYGKGFCEYEKASRTNEDDWWMPVKYVTHWTPIPKLPEESEDTE